MKAKLVAKNSLFLLAARGTEVLIRIAVMAIAARILGPKGFGEYAFVLTTTFFASLLIPCGTGSILVREIVRDRSRTGEYITAVMAIRLVMVVVVLALFSILVSVFPLSPSLYKAMLIMLAAHIIEAAGRTFSLPYMANEKMGFELLISMLAGAICLVIVLVTYFARLDPVTVYVAHLVSFSARTLFAFIVCRRYFFSGFDLAGLRHVGRFFRTSLPLLCSMSLRQLNIRIDVFFLKAMSSSYALGLFHAAHRTVTNVRTIPDSLSKALFPAISRMSKEAPEKLAGVFELVVRYSLLVALAGTVFVNIWAKPIIVILFSEEFADATLCLQVLSWVLVSILLNSMLDTFLVATDQQGVIVKVNLAGLVINMALDFLCIPLWGALGASAATLASYTVVTMLMIFCVSKEVGSTACWGILARLLSVTCASLLACFAAMPLGRVGATLVAGVVFITLTHLLSIVRSQDIQALRNMRKKR